MNNSSCEKIMNGFKPKTPEKILLHLKTFRQPLKNPGCLTDQDIKKSRYKSSNECFTALTGNHRDHIIFCLRKLPCLFRLPSFIRHVRGFRRLLDLNTIYGLSIRTIDKNININERR